MTIAAMPKTPVPEIIHAAKVYAQLIDNDENFHPDDIKIYHYHQEDYRGRNSLIVLVDNKIMDKKWIGFKPGQKFWFGNINVATRENKVESFSILVNDLQGKIYIYESSGKLLQKCNLGQPIILNGTEQIFFSDFLTSTGLQIKADPGINTVYLAFFFLIVSTYISFISYSQIWATETSQQVTLAGISNRAVLFFQSEFRKLLTKTIL